MNQWGVLKQELMNSLNNEPMYFWIMDLNHEQMISLDHESHLYHEPMNYLNHESTIF